MNAENLLLILEKEREDFFKNNNNKDSINNIIKQEKKLYMCSEYHLLAGVFYLIIPFTSLFIFPEFGKFVADGLIGFLSFMFISAFSSIALSLTTVKIFVNVMLRNLKYREKIINTRLENNFYNSKVSDEVFSMVKLLLNDDEYFQLMKQNRSISNKQALELAKDKILKDEILDEKKEIYLDLKKLKQYNVTH